MQLTIKHNITVAIDATLLKKARAVAARKGLSVSALLAEQLRELVDSTGRYDSARRKATALLAAPVPMGGAPLPREALHERRRVR
jgi:hypothetical protein